MFGLGLTAMLVGQMTALTAVDVVVRARPRAVAEFGQRRRLREPNRLYIDPGSGPATGADGAVGRCRPQRLFRPQLLFTRSERGLHLCLLICRFVAGPG